MSGNLYGLVIESLVAVLLVLTIGYCMVLNKRLTRLRSDESAMRGTIGELIGATQSAERAISDLRKIANETQDALNDGLISANRVTEDLNGQVQHAQDVLARIAQIAAAARSARQADASSPAAEFPASAEPAATGPAARAAQAAQALAQRARLRSEAA
jgi:hypothetical protein